MKQYLLALALLSLSSFSFSSNANECSTGGCGDSNSNLSGSQNQSQYNTLQQSPTMALNSSQSNTVVNATHQTNGSFSHSADGGINFGGGCPTNTLIFTGGAGNNRSHSRPSNYRSDSNNMYAAVSLVVPFGEAVDNCQEREAVSVKAAKYAYTKLQVSTCLVFMRQGINLQSLAEMDPQFSICPRIALEAERNFHDEIGRRAVEQYKKNMQAQGIDIYKGFRK
ncbi:hypothetical protein [Vibrio phage vB_pir03]|nr:hypothetical protein [Vibrio phage vB_pir03]